MSQHVEQRERERRCVFYLTTLLIAKLIYGWWKINETTIFIQFKERLTFERLVVTVHSHLHTHLWTPGCHGAQSPPYINFYFDLSFTVFIHLRLTASRYFTTVQTCSVCAIYYFVPISRSYLAIFTQTVQSRLSCSSTITVTHLHFPNKEDRFFHIFVF